MMRKDVKIGFAVGGVLVAVLVVYVLAVSGGAKKDAGVQLVDGPSPVPVGTTTAGEHPAAQPTDPFKPTTPDTSVASADHSSAAPPPSIPPEKSEPKGSDEDRWMLALSRGTVPMMSTTPAAPAAPSSGGATAQNKSADNKAAPKGSSSSSALPVVIAQKPASTDATSAEPDVTPINLSTSGAAPPATQPAGRSSSSKTVAGAAHGAAQTPAVPAGARTHVVQPNETITKIAQAAYGNSNFWPHIVRANPNVNPYKMKPGTVLTLPPESEVKAGLASSTSTDGKAESNTVAPMTVAHTEKPAAPLDPNTQYEVQPNDSLQRISTKLYGTSAKWQAIYDLNKATIGADPGKVKVKMVLKLPEPPTVKP